MSQKQKKEALSNKLQKKSKTKLSKAMDSNPPKSFPQEINNQIAKGTIVDNTIVGKKQKQSVLQKQNLSDIPKKKINNQGKDRDIEEDQCNKYLIKNDTVKKGKKQASSISCEKMLNCSMNLQGIQYSQSHQESFNNQKLSIESTYNQYQQSIGAEFEGVEIGDIHDLYLQKQEPLNEKNNIQEKLTYTDFCNLNKESQLDLIILQNQELIWNELQKKGYYLGKFLAKGAFGCVFEGYSHKLDFPNEIIDLAFKVIIDEDQDELQEEIESMKRFEGNINIIKFIDFIRLSNDISVIVLEKCKHSLKKELELIRTVQKNFLLEEFFQMILDLFDGLVQLRIFKTLHLDIKPDNILIAQNGSLVYADFGISQLSTKEIKVKGFTRMYAPDEQKQEDKKNLIEYKTDTYSLGKTISQIVETFKGVNQYYKIIEEFETQILDNMLKERIESREDCIKCHEKLIEIILNSQENKVQQILSHYLNKLQNIQKLFPFEENKDIPFFIDIKIYYYQIQLKIIEQLIQENTDEQQQNIDHDLLTTKTQLSQTHFELSLSYSLNGQFNESLKHSQICLKIFKLKYKENHPDIVTSLNNVGSCYQDIGDYKNALIHLLESLKMSHKLFKGNHPSVASSLNNVGLCYQEMGDFENAQNYLQKSLKMRQKLYNGNHESIASSLSNVGSCYLAIGDTENALIHFKKSLKMSQQLFKGNHPSIATSLNNVGLCHQDMGDSENARIHLLESLKMRKELFKGNHPSISTSLNNVGSYYQAIGDSENALIYFLDSLKMMKELFKGNHPSIATSLNNAGLCYQEIGDLENALIHFIESLNMKKELFKGNHPSIATSLSNVGSCYREIGDSEKAQIHFIESLKMNQQLFKGNNPSIATLLNNVGLGYKDMGDSENARIHLLESLKMRKQLFKGNHPSIATSLNNVGTFYQDIGDFKNALIYYIDSLKMMKKLFKGNHPSIATSLDNVGLCYQDMGDSENARIHFIESLKMRKELFKGNHPDIAESLNNVGLCYQDMGNSENARIHLLESLNMRKQLFKGNHPDIAESLCNLVKFYKSIDDKQNVIKYEEEQIQLQQHKTSIQNQN